MQTVVPPVGAAPVKLPQPGELLADRYLIERMVGSGGMGVVVEARLVPSGESVAIKMLRPEAAAQAESLARFMREAQAASSIQSVHVAHVTDVGTSPSGIPYMVMEYLEGHDLGQLLAKRTWLSPAQAVDYVMQACEAVAHAHRQGIVHRDLKPANLFLSEMPDGSPLIKVLDFGISKVTTPGSDIALTATSFAFGTPMYMSPEQVRSAKHVDPRTDMWALGAILHELLSGLPAFAGDSLPAISAAIIADPPRSLRAARPDVPEGLEKAVLWCLQKPLAARPASVLELVRALAPYGTPGLAQALVADIEQIGAPTAPLLPSSPGLDTSGGHPAWVASSTPSSASRRWMVLAGVASVVLGALGVSLVKMPGDATAAAASAPVAAIVSAAPSAPIAPATSAPAVVPAASAVTPAPTTSAKTAKATRPVARPSSTRPDSLQQKLLDLNNKR